MRRLSPANLFAAAVLSTAAGCGQSEPAATATDATAVAPQNVVRTAATPSEKADAPAATPVDESPEALIREVTRLSATTLTQTAGAEAMGLQPAGEVSLTPISNTAMAAAERDRNSEIVQLSMEVIARTHDDPEKAQIFNNAVHYMTRAQVELALTGDAESERQLIKNAEDLRQRDAQSFAAIESAAKVVDLAQRKAQQSGTADLAAAYARQARLFAAQFAHEPNRAAVTLLAAGRWCDEQGFARPAAECFQTLAADFPDSLFASQAAGALRRVSLVGRPLSEFGGPTIDGGFVRPEHYKGRPLAIIFWSATDETVPEAFAALDAARGRNADLAIIGVCLEDDERMAAMAVEQLPTCPQIYSAVPEERGSRNPLARHYGVEKTPLVWLVAADGRVVSVNAKPQDAGRL